MTKAFLRLVVTFQTPWTIAILVLIFTAGMIAYAAPVLKVAIEQVSNPAPQPGAGFGESVAGVGDVNADGISDLVVGAPGASRVYIFSGATRSVIRTISDPNGSGHRFGFAVAPAGDVDGDGIGDVAVGAPGPTLAPIPTPCVIPPCPQPDPLFGRAFVFSGKTGALIRTIAPADDFAGFGISVVSMGDINADGVPDLAVGMVPFGLTNSIGRVYAFSGKTNALLWKTDEPGGKQIPSFGLRLGSIADLNGDGRRDLLASSPFHDVNPDPNVFILAGEAYVLSGATGIVFRTHADPSPADNDLFGSAVTAVGDQDGDGFEDYAIGKAGKGLVYLYSGKTGNSAGTKSSATAGDNFGLTIANAGDQDGDGKADFWIGAPGSGKAYLMPWTGTTLATAADSAGSQPMTGGFAWSMAATGNLGGDSPGDLIVGKPGDEEGGGAAFVVLLAANKPPVANAGSDQTIECTGPTGTAVLLDGSGSTDPDGDSLTYEWRNSNNVVVGTAAKLSLTLGRGPFTFTLTVSDGFGGTSTDSVTIVVQDTTPPSLSLSLSKNVLFPPNHRLELITASVAAADVCDAAPSVQLISITSNEPDDGLGDGDTAGDIQDAAFGTNDTSFLLRAERSGLGSGRIYAVTYRATDAASNQSTKSAEVVVPH